MQQASETTEVYKFIGFCVALGAAGYKYYQYLTASDDAAIRREREIISIQREQLEELREMTTELDDITTANAVLLQDSAAQLKELEALLFPEEHQAATKGTNTGDLLRSLNHNQPKPSQNTPTEKAADDSPQNVTEQTENSAVPDLTIIEDYPAEKFSPYT